MQHCLSVKVYAGRSEQAHGGMRFVVTSNFVCKITYQSTLMVAKKGANSSRVVPA